MPDSSDIRVVGEIWRRKKEATATSARPTFNICNVPLHPLLNSDIASDLSRARGCV
ncbi:hypothetical protein ALC57_06528 [Trachymyrmex cornetzi]|uniref:Uncharacterized protein n=1 Tax=Trachymyrmex cornetzi TaxID=471704 RepID=A0A151J8H4_9HYME|nr:hypothetical protein ALC57_06528 [Trachymyrmex cornetzi]